VVELPMCRSYEISRMHANIAKNAIPDAAHWFDDASRQARSITGLMKAEALEAWRIKTFTPDSNTSIHVLGSCYIDAKHLHSCNLKRTRARRSYFR
jgi:hypothetical protein